MNLNFSVKSKVHFSLFLFADPKSNSAENKYQYISVGGSKTGTNLNSGILTSSGLLFQESVS